jgi:hypothetical protein
MNEEIRALSTALSQIRQLVAKQRSRANYAVAPEVPKEQEMRVFRDLDVELAIGRPESHVFERKVVAVDDRRAEGPDWRTTASAVGVVSESDAKNRRHARRDVKRFVCVLRDETTDDAKRRQKKIVVDDMTSTTCRDITRRDVMPKTSAKKTSIAKLRPTTAERPQSERSAKTASPMATADESVENRVQRLLESAVREVPDWETLFGRVYGERSALSPQMATKSAKAMEVFPKSRVTSPPDPPSPQERVSALRRELNLSLDDMSGHVSAVSPKMSDCFRLTSDLEDMATDDDTDDVSTLKSEVMETEAEVDVRKFLTDECARLLAADDCRKPPKPSPRDSFRALLFDLTAEALREELRTKIPRPTHALKEAVVVRALQWLQPKTTLPDVRRDGLSSFCRRSRRRDLVDAVLYEEIVAEERRWTHFGPEVVAVKERVCDLLVGQLLAEAVAEWRASKTS